MVGFGAFLQTAWILEVWGFRLELKGFFGSSVGALTIIIIRVIMIMIIIMIILMIIIILIRIGFWVSLNDKHNSEPPK